MSELSDFVDKPESIDKPEIPENKFEKDSPVGKECSDNLQESLDKESPFAEMTPEQEAAFAEFDKMQAEIEGKPLSETSESLNESAQLPEEPEVNSYKYIDSNKITPERDVNDSHFYDSRGIDSHTSKEGAEQRAEYEKLANNIPEVRDRIDAGESLAELKTDEKVGDTANLYFDEKNMIAVNDNGDGTYQLAGDGNHRLKAAQDLGYDVPVKVLGED